MRTLISISLQPSNKASPPHLARNDAHLKIREMLLKTKTPRNDPRSNNHQGPIPTETSRLPRRNLDPCICTLTKINDLTCSKSHFLYFINRFEGACANLLSCKRLEDQPAASYQNERLRWSANS